MSSRSKRSTRNPGIGQLVWKWPINFLHSEHRDDLRLWTLHNFPKVLEIFMGTSFPQYFSAQGIDLRLLKRASGVTATDFGDRLMGGLWSHVLTSLLTTRMKETDPLYEHAMWQMRHGVQATTDVPTFFYPEYDTPNVAAFLPRGAIIPVVARPRACTRSVPWLTCTPTIRSPSTRP